MIKDLHDLKKLLKLCAQHGVTEISLGDVRLKLGEAPKIMPGDIEEMDEQDVVSQFEAPISPEELTAFASGAL